ncbi:MAG: signal transduction histidine kinase/DNA-binding response OmpR family regulator [Halioglobus sp.]|jgi:signal transduction histidine kinase/DNA-binding response OmpR family regulator
MNQPLDICWGDLHSLFSVVMCIDKSMNLVYVSDTLSKCMPETKHEPKLLEVFNTLRPTSLATFNDGIKVLGSLCLLTARNKKFAIRGQLLRTQYHKQDVLCFCGAPWVFWINSECPETQLSLSDFSAQDMQLDQLFFMSTERKMVDDLEQLNTELGAAKQQLEEAQEAQRQLFVQISHEIRTPLNGVVSALSLLEDHPTDPEQSKLLRLAHSSSENLMQVINYVLNVSKLEMAPHQGQEVFSWPNLIRSTIDMIAAKAQEKSLQVKLDLSPKLPDRCYGNPARLRQTLLNLAINAIKFTNTGTITIRALPVHQTPDHCILRLEVINTGIGISEEDLPHIFEPFWSSQPEGITTQTDRHFCDDSTGLGLDIVRRNVRSMGGEIMVKSTPGQETKFWFELPATLPTESEPVSVIAEAQQEADTRKLTGSIMLVDDSETNLLVGAMILESMGLEVTKVDGGAAAVATARQQQFDLVLMDLSMPDIDGLEATRQIRTFASSEMLKIVALTAHIDEKEKEAGFEIGLDGYLAKPIAREKLYRALTTWLSKDKKLPSKEAVENTTYQTSIIDIELVAESVLEELTREIGRDNLRIVINKVCTEATLRWDELTAADKQGDKEAIQRHVHSLASIFRSVGLMPAGDALGAIETKLRAGEEVPSGWLTALENLKTDSIIALVEQMDEASIPSPTDPIDTKWSASQHNVCY